MIGAHEVLQNRPTEAIGRLPFQKPQNHSIQDVEVANPDPLTM